MKIPYAIICMKIPIDGYRPVLLVMVPDCGYGLTKIKGPTQYVSP